MQSQLLEVAASVILENKELLIAGINQQHYIDFVDSSGEPLRTEVRKYLFDFSGNSSPFRLLDKSTADDEIDVIIDGDTYDIVSPATTKDGVSKAKYLEAWNGSPIMDLTIENRDIIREKLSPLFAEKLAEMI